MKYQTKIIIAAIAFLVILVIPRGANAVAIIIGAVFQWTLLAVIAYFIYKWIKNPNKKGGWKRPDVEAEERYENGNQYQEQHRQSGEQTEEKTPYEILGVEPSMSFEEIKRVYKNLSKTYHPDNNSSSTAADRMKAINNAWDAIKEERER